MAYSAWNQAMGNRCWDDIKREKIAVYGKKNFCQAIKNIIDCNSTCTASLPPECIDLLSSNTDIGAGWIMLIIISVIATICIIIYIINYICYCSCTRYHIARKFGYHYI